MQIKELLQFDLAADRDWLMRSIGLIKALSCTIQEWMSRHRWCGRDGKTLANWIRERLGIEQADYQRVG